MTGVFSNYARYYDALYHDKDYTAEAEYFSGLIRRFESTPTTTLLEFGAGSGAHQAALRELGYNITGVELSEDMCELASQRGANVAIGDFRDYDHPETVDAVLALFHVVNYLTSDSDLRAGFANARRHLKPGGLFVFDMWFEDAVVSEQPETRVKRVSANGLDVVRVAEPQWNKLDKTVQVNYSVFAKEHGQTLWEMSEESHLMRYLSLEDVKQIASETGFEVSHAEETLTGVAPSPLTWGVSVVLAAR